MKSERPLNRRYIFTMIALIVISVMAGIIHYLTVGNSIKLPAGYQTGDVVTEFSYAIREAGDKVDWSNRVIVERKVAPSRLITVQFTERPKGFVEESDARPSLICTFQHGEMSIKEDLPKRFSNWRQHLASTQNMNLGKAASKAISILSPNGTISDSFEIDADNDPTGFHVLVTWLPAIPGSHVGVSLSPTFQHVETMPGM